MADVCDGAAAGVVWATADEGGVWATPGEGGRLGADVGAAGVVRVGVGIGLILAVLN